MSEWRASLLAALSLTKHRPLISSSDLPSGPGGSALMDFASFAFSDLILTSVV